MRVVYKYPLDHGETQIAWRPSSKVVHVGTALEGAMPLLWIEHEIGDSLEVRIFRFFGTGQSIDDDALVHVGSTVHAPSGLVWHVYAEGR